MPNKINCPKHGEIGFGIACIHICQAIDTSKNVGFYWCEHDEPRLSRPDAWCSDCEDFMKKNPAATAEQIKQVCDFQFLCENCWDEAKEKLYKKNG